MMKKLLALLLALMMLPCCALADFIGMDLSWTLSPEGAIELISAYNGGQRYPLVNAWLEELASFVNEFRIGSAVDEEIGYGHVSLRYRGEDIITYEAAVTDQGTVVRHTLLPDTLLLVSPGNLFQQSANTLPKAWNAVDWEATLLAFRTVFVRWADAVEASDEEMGRFVGDAYSGGVYRVTASFDDRDLALLMSMLLDYPWPESFTSLMGLPVLCASAAPDEVRDFLQGEIRKLALSNRCRYVLHLVSDEEHEPIGLSLIVYLDEHQVATLSLGIPRDREELTFVLGWGLRNQNCYLAGQLFEPDEKGRFLSAALLKDASRTQNVQAIFADPSNTLMRLSAYDQSSDQSVSLQFVASGEALMGTTVNLALTHTADEGTTASSALIKLNDQPLLQTRLNYDFTQSLEAPDISGQEPLDLNSLSQEEVLALFDAIDKASVKLSVELFKLMPPKLILLPLNDDFLSPE